MAFSEPTVEDFMGAEVPDFGNHIWQMRRYNHRCRSILVANRVTVATHEIEPDDRYDPLYIAEFSISSGPPLYKVIENALDLDHAFDIFAEVVCEQVQQLIERAKSQAARNALGGGATPPLIVPGA